MRGSVAKRLRRMPRLTQRTWHAFARTPSRETMVMVPYKDDQGTVRERLEKAVLAGYIVLSPTCGRAIYQKAKRLRHSHEWTQQGWRALRGIEVMPSSFLG